MSPARVPYRRILLPFALALLLVVESVAVASAVFARSAPTDGGSGSTATTSFVPLATEAGIRERSVDDAQPVFDANLAPIAEPAAPIRVLQQPVLASVNKAKSQPKAKSGGSGGSASSAPAGGTSSTSRAITRRSRRWR